MMAMLFAIKIAKGLFEFKNVPRLLKAGVKEELENMDLGHLATEE